MIPWLKNRPEPQSKRKTKRGGQRFAEVGWLVDADQADFIYDAPKPVAQKGKAPGHPKAVGHCPAVVDHEARLFEVPCPFDLHLRIGRNDQGQAVLINAAGTSSAVSKGKLEKLVHLTGSDRWRHPHRPVLQVSAPWRFIADQPTWITQLPPFNHYRDPAWPGLLIGGRFPLHDWPRLLMWAFEWWDTSKDLVLKRGEPWFYARFETADPDRPVRLVEAEMTPELRSFCEGLDGVTNYVNQTAKLFSVANARRPETLLKKKSAQSRPPKNS